MAVFRHWSRDISSAAGAGGRAGAGCADDRDDATVTRRAAPARACAVRRMSFIIFVENLPSAGDGAPADQDAGGRIAGGARSKANSSVGTGRPNR